MTLRTRVHAIQRAAERLPGHADADRRSVLDRIDQLAAAFTERPPALSAAVEAGIAAAADREVRWAVIADAIDPA